MRTLIITSLFLVITATISSVTTFAADSEADPRSNYEANEGIDRFYVRATGDLEYENSFVIPERTPTQEVMWSCSSGILRVGYSWGLFASPEWEVMGFVVESEVASGQVGEFELQGMNWAYGREPMPGQPADSAIQVPRRFEGVGGELELTSHVPDSSQRRIRGVAQGEVKAMNSDLTVQLYMEFDLSDACR